MRYFPVFLDLEGMTVAVAGGGEVAANKLRLFAKTGAKLVCTALTFNDEIAAMIEAGRVTPRKLDPKWASFGDAFIVIAATESSDDEAIARRAKALGILINAVDKTEFCTFITPSFADRSPVIVAIGTEGQAPVLARRLREQIEIALPESLGMLARFIGVHREAVSELLPKTPDRRRFWENVVDGPIAKLIAEGRMADATEAFERLMHSLANPKSAPSPDADGLRAGAGKIETAAAISNDAVTLIVSPLNAEDLTLKALRALQDADAIFAHESVPSPVLDKARRDASRESFSELPDLERLLKASPEERETPRRLVCLLQSNEEGSAIAALLHSLASAVQSVDVCSVAISPLAQMPLTSADTRLAAPELQD